MSCKLARCLQKSVTVVGEEADSKTGISTWGTEQLNNILMSKMQHHPALLKHQWCNML